MNIYSKTVLILLFSISLHTVAATLFTENFEDGNFSARWSQVQDNGNPLKSVTPSGFKAREGSKVGMFHFTGKSERVELARPKALNFMNGYIPDGSEVWFGGSILVPSSMKGSSGGALVQQWHGGPCSNCKSGQTGVPLCMILKGGKLYLSNAHTTKPFLGGNTSVQVQYDTWIDIVMHMKWSRKNDGICEFWGGTSIQAEKPQFSRKNITTLGNHDWDNSRVQKDVYVKIGMYNGPSNQMVYWDAVRLGQSFADVAPGGGQASATPETPAASEIDFTATHVKINFGGLAQGWVYGDGFAKGAQAFTFGGMVGTEGVAGAAPAAVYQTVVHRAESIDPLIIDLPGVPDGACSVRLHVTDQYGGRAIDITAEGIPVVTDLDPMTEAGGAMKAVVKEAAITVSGGDGLQIVLNDDRAEPKDVFLSGLEIIRSGVATSIAPAWDRASRPVRFSRQYLPSGRVLRSGQRTGGIMIGPFQQARIFGWNHRR